MWKSSVPNLVEIKDLPYEKDGKTRHRYLMPRYDQNFKKYVERLKESGGRRLSPQAMKSILSKLLAILDTLRHMHVNLWVHGDVKTRNIFLMEDTVAVGDFSYSKKINDLEGWAGTCGYIAPEKLSSVRLKPIAPANDMWSFGIMLYESTQRQRAPFGISHSNIVKLLVKRRTAAKELIASRENEILGKGEKADPCAIEEIKHRYLQKLVQLDEDVQRDLQGQIGELNRKIVQVLDTLHDEKDPVKMLIRDLLAIEPSQRPTAAQAFERLGQMLQQF